MSYREAPGFVRLHFGDAWGFNITQFTEERMKAAAMKLQKKHPRKDWGKDPGSAGAPFLIAEDVTAYFGMAVPLMWVSIALLGVGLIDRLAIVADLKKEGEED